MKAKVKYSWKQYFEPTPKRIRVYADSLLASSIFIGGYSVINDYPKFGMAVILVGGLAKFWSNFFAEEPEQQKEAETPDCEKPAENEATN